MRLANICIVVVNVKIEDFKLGVLRTPIYVNERIVGKNTDKAMEILFSKSTRFELLFTSI